jgi:hypothetical protein
MEERGRSFLLAWAIQKETTNHAGQEKEQQYQSSWSPHVIFTIILSFSGQSARTSES